MLYYVKNTLFKCLVVVALLTTTGMIRGQNDPQLTQFAANKLFFNPAATSVDDLLHISLTDREQWMGFSNGYRTLMLNATQYLADYRSGVGVSVMSSKQNVENNLNFKLSYAYHLQVQESSFLAMGLSLGMLNTSITNGTKPDGSLINVKNAWNDDIGLGVEFYTPEFFVGVSVTHLPLYIAENEAQKNMHIYYYFSYFYEINQNWMIIPGFVVRNPSFITNFDANLRISYSDRFLLGASVRRDAFAILAGVSIGPITVGYSYDFNTGFMKSAGAPGSHEITLGIRTQIIRGQTRLDRMDIHPDI